MKAQVKSLVAALQFLTRLQVGGCPRKEDFLSSPTYFPLVGLALAGILYLFWWGVLFRLPFPAQAGLLLAVEVYLTGGIHLDGFMDTCDGLFSGRQRERILEIMKDSHVGAHGVTAAISLLLVKFSLFLSLLENLRPALINGVGLAFAGLAPALILMLVLARWAMVLALNIFPYVRPQGLGVLLGAGKVRGPLYLASALTLAIVYGSARWWGLILMATVALFTFWWGRWVSRFIGGLTGDTYGALAELVEVLVLFILVVIT